MQVHLATVRWPWRQAVDRLRHSATAFESLAKLLYISADDLLKIQVIRLGVLVVSERAASNTTSIEGNL